MLDKQGTVHEVWDNAGDILQKIWLYILFWVGVGELIHGYVSSDFIAKYAGGDSWYVVPLAVLLGIPMYFNTSGGMSLVDVYTSKELLLGTALGFMMAITALLLLEAMILKKYSTQILITKFFSIVGTWNILYRVFVQLYFRNFRVSVC